MESTEQVHEHIYNKAGEKICCSLEAKIMKQAEVPHDHGDGHDHSQPLNSRFQTYAWPSISFAILVAGLIMDHFIHPTFFEGPFRIVWYVIAYLPVGLPVIKEAWQALRTGEVFTEFFLMSIATIGAFAIGEYPEGVAVMLFYAVGELFQSAAVRKAKSSITALLDLRPKTASVKRKGTFLSVDAEKVELGEIVQVKVGEAIPLDGRLISDSAMVNTAALSGESKPMTLAKDEQVFAGSINLDGIIELKVDKVFKDSSVSRILELVEHAKDKKAKTELLIRRLAKVYTPIVVYLAIAICVLPYFFVDDYVFTDWIYRALIFLVISCPCALVISIPLGYFGGLGAASKFGLLFKGASYLDDITAIKTVVMDKTGTVTKGVFKIKDIVPKADWTEADLMQNLLSIESKSTHPIAKAVMAYDPTMELMEVSELKEIAGKGMVGKLNDKDFIVGNEKLLVQHGIPVPEETKHIVESIVMMAVDGDFAGYVTLADEIKEDAQQAIDDMRAEGIERIVMLSGDKDSITQQVAGQLGIDEAKGGLSPEDKLNEVELLKQHGKVAFLGDGINDAPVLAASDIGFAMGAMGSDVAIETADVIIQTDRISRFTTGVRIGRSTKKVIMQNIYLAFGVKIIVLILGAMGMATMWDAVFADVGVALLAILNAVRLQRMTWN